MSAFLRRNVLNKLAAVGGTLLIGSSTRAAESAQNTAPGKAPACPSLKDFGAVCNGIADDTAAVAAAIRASATVLPVADQVLIGAVTLGDNMRLYMGKFKGKQGNAATVNIAAGAGDVKLVGMSINAQGGTAFNHNQAGAKNLLLLGNSISTTGAFGVLSNSKASGSNGAAILGNHVLSETGDAIELNHPLADTGGFTVVGNVLTAGPTGAGSSAGFAVGVAGTQGTTIVGNVVLSSRLEAFHFEDSQRRTVLVANTAAAVLGDGVRVLPPKRTAPDSDGVVIVGNHIQHTGAKIGFQGVHNVYNPEGAQDLNVITANYVRNFDCGYNLNGGNVQATGINVAEGCNVSVSTTSGVALGTFYSKDTPILFRAGRAAIGGKFVSSTAVTDILVRAATGFPGPYIKGFVVPITAVHAGGGSANIDAFALPSRMGGRITITAGNGTNGIFITAEVDWDGTTLIVTRKLSSINGAVSSPEIVNNAGILTLRLTSSVAFSWPGRVDFDGVFYRNT